MIPRPIQTVENPLSAAASYANQVLAGLGQGTTAPGVANRGPGRASMGSSLPGRTVQDRVGMISQGASRQHQQVASRLRNARQLSVPTSGGRGGGAQAGGYRGAGTGGIHGLTPQAGSAFARLNAAYKDRWGQSLIVNSGGRTGEQQQRLRDLYLAGKGNLAAPRGQSVHESGRAVDLGGAAHYSTTPQHAWLRANAGRFGWLWTGKNFSQREDWHWEFQG